MNIPDPQDTIDAAITTIINRETKDCCTGDLWRGRLCGYHEGLTDGLGLAFELDELKALRSQ